MCIFSMPPRDGGKTPFSAHTHRGHPSHMENDRQFVDPGFCKEAKDKGTNFYDLGSVQKIQTRSQVSLDLWAIHMKGPTAALADKLKRTEQKSGLASSATSEL